jgi:hypothetical protein
MPSDKSSNSPDYDLERNKRVAQYLEQRLELSKPKLGELLYPGYEAKTQADKIRRLFDEKGWQPIPLGTFVKALIKLQSPNDLTKQEPLSLEEVLMLLQMFTQLNSEEKRGLGLPRLPEEALLNQAFVNFLRYNQYAYNEQETCDFETVLNFYQASIAISLSNQNISTLWNRESLDQQIEKQAQATLRRLLPTKVTKAKLADRTQEMKQKVLDEIEKIFLQSGVKHGVLPEENDQNEYIQRYLPLSYVNRLTQSVVENSLLTESSQFPIFIRTVTIKDVQSLPLPIGISGRGCLLNQHILDLSPQEESLLAKQYACEVTVHGYLMNSALPVEFSISSRGIGGSLSQVSRILNTILLSDSQHDRLQGVFSVSHDVMLDQSIIRNGNPSPVWAHNHIMLCLADDITKALKLSKKSKGITPYQEVTSPVHFACADCCGFDLLFSAAKAALYSRLKAIRTLGISAKDYMASLNASIQRTNSLEQAYAYASSYPFSSIAQEQQLSLQLGAYKDRELSSADPNWVFDIYLTIAETFLAEGMYLRALPYLNKMKATLNPIVDAYIQWYRAFKEDSDSSNIERLKDFSSTLLARYQICWATYYYVFDFREEKNNQRHWGLLRDAPNQQTVIDKSWSLLDVAQQLVAVRLAKYRVIQEVSQGTLYPHYHLLAQIYWLRARLLLFFPHRVRIARNNEDREILPTDKTVNGNQRGEKESYSGWLYLFEKARLYAASDGDRLLYSSITAYQCCTYLIIAYSGRALSLMDQREPTLTRNECFAWTRQIRDHALLSYAETGLHCYEQIQAFNRTSNDYQIEPIPAIRALLASDEGEPGLRNGVLYLDMELLVISQNDLCCKDGSSLRDLIYLFGTSASYLLFARGLYHLCSDDADEFQENPIQYETQDWMKKLKRSYQLFLYAWAMADAGGTVGSSSPNGPLRIQRRFETQDLAKFDDYIPAEVASVKDLFPRQVTEISDLSKIFATACLVLQVYLNEQDREHLSLKITTLLRSLHRERYCRSILAMPQILNGQKRYNGHIKEYIQICKRILLKEMKRLKGQQGTTAEINGYRNQLIQKLFERIYSF